MPTSLTSQQIKDIDGQPHKHCSRCRQYRPLDRFEKRKEMRCGYRSECKDCQRDYNRTKKEYHRVYARNRQDKLRETGQDYYTLNREKILAKKKARYCPVREKQKNAKRKDKIKAYNSRAEVRAVKNARWNGRYHSDLQFKMKANLKSRVYNLMRRYMTQRCTDRNLELLGCSLSELRDHLESLFIGEMTWEAFMRGEIHIDHRRPCSSFDLTNPDEQRACFHWTNLQPLWAEDNLSKGAKWEPSQGEKSGVAGR